MTVDLNEPFPILPEEINIIFDLAGSISNSAHSITSAIKQSDLVLVPICNELKSINAGLNTLAEIMNINQNLAVIATKLQKKRKNDIFNHWQGSIDFKNIKNAVHGKVSPNIHILPLKYSVVFDNIFEKERSIQQIMQES